MSNIFANFIQRNSSISINQREGFSFHLSHATLDPQSDKAHLFLKHEGRQILILELDRNQNYPRVSQSLSIQFNPSQKLRLKSKLGKVHLIGSFKPIPCNTVNSEKIAIVEEQSSPQKNQTQSPPLQQEPRRSSRRPAPVKTPESKIKERQSLKNMASIFELDAKDLDDDEDDDDDSFSNKSQGSESEDKQDFDEEDFAPKKKVKKEEKLQSEQFSTPTKNPFL